MIKMWINQTVCTAKRVVLILVLLASCYPLNDSAAQTTDPVRLVVDPWPPFGGADLPQGGISSDVIGTILRRAGYKVETAIVPWERALDGVQSGTYDVIGNLFYSADLAEQLTFSEPFFRTEVRFIQQRGAGHVFTSIDSLRPHTIAVGSGYLYEPAFDAADHLAKTVVTEVIQGVRMVASGRIDLTLDSVDVLRHIVHRQAPDLAPLVEILPEPLTVQEIHMAVRNDFPGREKLVADFNLMLTQMRTEGALDELLAKHRNY